MARTASAHLRGRGPHAPGIRPPRRSKHPGRPGRPRQLSTPARPRIREAGLMGFRAATREKTRRLLGALLISLGTAVFSGAVAVLVDGLINGKPLRWWYITAFTVAGLLLSGGG